MNTYMMNDPASPACSSPLLAGVMQQLQNPPSSSSIASSGAGSSPRHASAAAATAQAGPVLKGDRAWVLGEGIINEPIYQTDEFR